MAVSQQTRDTEPLLIQCRPIVSDSVPTLNQHRPSVRCLLGIHHLYLTCLVYSFIQKYNKIRSFMSTMKKWF